MSNSTSRGFTLIELLVVIAIIGILASVVLASLNSARASGRDASRKAQLGEIEKALQLHWVNVGRYPTGADGTCAHNTSAGSGGCLQALVTNGYISEIPTDPSGSAYSYDNWCRDTGSNSQNYRMWTREAETDQGSLAENWWDDYTIGIKTCNDPS